jgi:hypothetical protein
MNARRLVSTVSAVVVGVLMFACGSALAAAPEAPETGKATVVTATSAKLGGVLNPHAAGVAGVYYFVYAPRGLACTEYGFSVEAISAGFEKEPVAPPVEVAGLEPSTQYAFCLVDRNEAGEATVGSSETFTTLAAAPAVEGETSSGVSSTAATLEAQVNPNNQVTSCEVQYGTTTAYGTKAACEPASLNGFGDQRAALPVTGLTPGTTYHFRIVAENAGKEKTEGTDQTVTTVPTPHTDPVTAVAATTATLNGHLTLDPVDTQYFFYYKVGSECTGEKQTTTKDAGSGPGTLASPEEPVTGLIPATQYMVCFVTSNAFGFEQGSLVSFTTLPASPVSIGESVTEVTATSARLSAEIDPGGAETTYHFDYGTTTAYESSTPESVSVGADNSEHPAIAEIQGLQPDTTYHYRVVATNSRSPVGGTPGPDRVFTTQTTGGEFSLPDGRGYELVSPPQKDGAEVLGIGGGNLTPEAGGATQASEDGTSVTYLANAPVGVGLPGNTLSTQVFSTRGPGGWSSKDISIPHRFPVGNDKLLAEGEEYRWFSNDLSHAVIVSPHEALQAPLAPEIHQEVAGGVRSYAGPTSQEIYLRDNLTEIFRAVVTTEPLPKVEFEGATPDLSHVVFEGPAGLDPRYPHGGSLYEWAAGNIQLVDVLPDEEPVGNGLLGSLFERSTNGPIISGAGHAISDDGTRVVWVGESGLFTRDMTSGKTVQVDAARGGGGPSGGGSFLAASSNGSRVFFVDSHELTSGAHEGGLFMFDVAGNQLTDLTPKGTGGESLVGANEEGTSLYVSSSAVLSESPNSQGQVATAGESNLYVIRETPVGSGSWSTMFITSGMEEGTENTISAKTPQAAQTSRVSPNGRFLAFMSQQSLTGYDNRDVNSGLPDEEVYLYDAETNRLVCASCDPTGARPVGHYDTGEFPWLSMEPWGVWETHSLAASIPGWTPNGKLTSGHQPRYLSDSGRLFFDSADGLVPQDINGKVDVYEYEPVGVGSCESPSYGENASNVFSQSTGGCVGLISAGTGSLDSAFFDANASGSDVFFTTSDGLVAEDQDGVADMYDARECTTSEPCKPSLAVPPACTTTDSCRTAPSLQPGIFGPSGSATFVGAGNVTPGSNSVPKQKTKTKIAGQLRKEKLARALRACLKHRKRRAVCEARAKKRYGKAKTNARRVK